MVGRNFSAIDMNANLNCKNQTVFIGDNVDIMRGLNSACADLICADPPFNKNKKFDHVFGGKRSFGFDDAWSLHAERGEEHELLQAEYLDLYHVCIMGGKMHSRAMLGYLTFMAVRLLECRRILKETGSIYLHCDHSANAYLRLLMDGVFGEQNFRNEIIWCYSKWSNIANRFQQNTDTILYFAKSEAATFHVQRVFSDDKKLKMSKGYITNTVRNAKSPSGRIRQLIVYDRVKASSKIAKGDYDNIVYAESKGSPMGNWWQIPHLNSQAKERSGWATQKPLALYSRMVLASSNPGDVVLDPFCGCATTLVAAENAGRRWVGIDRHPEAKKQVVAQLEKLNEGTEDWLRKVIIREDIPQRTDLGNLPSYKKHFAELYTKQDGYCAGCGERRDKHVMHIDHKVPKSKGGPDHIDNLQILCSGCNSLKGNRTMAWLKKELKKRGLMNPHRNGRETQ